MLWCSHVCFKNEITCSNFIVPLLFCVKSCNNKWTFYIILDLLLNFIFFYFRWFINGRLAVWMEITKFSVFLVEYKTFIWVKYFKFWILMLPKCEIYIEDYKYSYQLGKNNRDGASVFFEELNLEIADSGVKSFKV